MEYFFGVDAGAGGCGSTRLCYLHYIITPSQSCVSLAHKPGEPSILETKSPLHGKTSWEKTAGDLDN